MGLILNFNGEDVPDINSPPDKGIIVPCINSIPDKPPRWYSSAINHGIDNSIRNLG